MKTFFSSFFSSYLAAMVAIATIAGGFFLMMMLVVASGQTPVLARKSVLVLDLSKPISDKPAIEELGDFTNPLVAPPVDSIPLRDLLTCLDQAAKDDRIVGIFLTGDLNSSGLFSGWATIAELRKALEAFKASGKPIISYNLNYGEGHLFLASCADKLYLNPFGLVECNGFAAELLYFGKALEKYGIGVQVSRVGKYKSAVEPYLLDKMSDANREQIGMLLNDIGDIVVETVAQARGIDPADLTALIDGEGFASGAQAVSAGLVDGVRYYDEVLSELKELTETKPEKDLERVIEMEDYYAAISARAVHFSKNKIAVIYAEGSIVDGRNEKEVGGVTLAEYLRKARLDKHVKAVVLRVNSPGGSATASEIIQRETRLIKQEKPLFVSMGSLAASGGYWISAYADQIYAQPNTITGSIGVFGLFPNFQGLLNEHGIFVDVAKTGEKADIYSVYRPKSIAELETIQHQIDFIYDQFLDKVAEGRGLERERVHEIAQGRVWSGAEAIQLGLVDHLGGLEDTLAAVAEKAGLGDDYQVIQYQVKRDLMQSLIEELKTEASAASGGLMSTGLNDLRGLLNQLETFNDPNGIYLRLPCDLTIR